MYSHSLIVRKRQTERHSMNWPVSIHQTNWPVRSKVTYIRLPTTDRRRLRRHAGFPEGTVVKNPPASAGDAEVQVPSRCWKHPLEGGRGTDSSILAWNIPWTEEPGGLQSTGSQRAGHDWAHTHTHTHTQLNTARHSGEDIGRRQGHWKIQIKSVV